MVKVVAICTCTIGICFAIQPEILHPILGLPSHSIAHMEQNGTSNGQNGISTEQNRTSIGQSQTSIGHNQTSNNTEYDNGETSALTEESISNLRDEIIGYILSSVNGVMSALCIAMSRKLTSEDEFHAHYISYLFWHCTFGIIMSCGLMLVGKNYY